MPPNTKKCETCNWRESEIGYPSPCPKHTTPSPEKCTKKEGNCASSNQHTQIMDKSVNLEKSEHDGTCRTPECYEKRPTPAVEDCEEKLKVMILSRGMGVSLNDCVNYVRSLLKSDRKRIIEAVIEDYSSWLDKNGYMDSDWYTEEPRATEAYLKSKSYQAFITNLK